MPLNSSDFLIFPIIDFGGGLIDYQRLLSNSPNLYMKKETTIIPRTMNGVIGGVLTRILNEAYRKVRVADIIKIATIPTTKGCLCSLNLFHELIKLRIITLIHLLMNEKGKNFLSFSLFSIIKN